MHREYHLFCQADPFFYDLPSPMNDFATVPPPADWRCVDDHEWRSRAPKCAGLPAQGWKIHVSGCPDNAERLIGLVHRYCVPRGIAFKFLRGPHAVFQRNAKYAPRAGSGKVVTIYPCDVAELERVCGELGAALAGEHGPYILSDVRIGAGPLYVRYGGFARRDCVTADG
ncbi:hypothetical protein ACIBQX_39510 [Nonomuraea sp. NPDC049714]|uniref:class III lanthionine synthetase LanKC N-terminal domain-containing protein n=1 Tax=Nonomuraea sp. NPDC049714 TaxID=3364357 RepID=UPI0037B58FF7